MRRSRRRHASLLFPNRYLKGQAREQPLRVLTRESQPEKKACAFELMEAEKGSFFSSGGPPGRGWHRNPQPAGPGTRQASEQSVDCGPHGRQALSLRRQLRQPGALAQPRQFRPPCHATGQSRLSGSRKSVASPTSVCANPTFPQILQPPHLTHLKLLSGIQRARGMGPHVSSVTR